MDKKRVFVAIDVSEAARAAVSEHIVRIRKSHPDIRARWVAPENLHVTMRFVGNVDAEGLKDLDERVQGVAGRFKEIEATLAETGNFARRRDRTDTLWIGVKALGETLGEMSAALEGTPVRKFVPHLTIARIKDAAQAGPLIDAHRWSRFQPINYIVRDLVIYESTLTSKGSVYSVLSKHSLNAP